MKPTYSAKFVWILLVWLTGCGAPMGFMFPDGAEPSDDSAVTADTTPVVDEAVSVEADAAVVPPEDMAVVEDEDAGMVSEDADLAPSETAVPSDVIEESVISYLDTSGPVDPRSDSGPDVYDATPDTRDSGPEASPDVFVGCRVAADCNDGMADTRDWCEFGGTCRHERCDDGNPCTANVGTETACSFPVLPNGTTCRPGPTVFTCTAGVCPACGGENQACCEWPGSTSVCQGTARCRTTAAGFRRCITCGHPGERCCLTADGIMWASERCDPSATCSSAPGVAGTCR